MLREQEVKSNLEQEENRLRLGEPEFKVFETEGTGLGPYAENLKVFPDEREINSR